MITAASGAAPRTVYPMPEVIREKVLDQLPSVPTAKMVVFTGGEPTLQWDALLDSIRKFTAGGLPTRVVTNGWWARTPAKAAETVAALREAGLHEINTSFDDFHDPFVEPEQIANLIGSSIHADMRVGLGVVVNKEARWNAETVRVVIADRLGVSRDELEKVSNDHR